MRLTQGIGYVAAKLVGAVRSVHELCEDDGIIHGEVDRFVPEDGTNQLFQSAGERLRQISGLNPAFDLALNQIGVELDGRARAAN